MKNESNEPHIDLDQSTPLVETRETHSPAVATWLEDSFFETRRLRKDGWDGAHMAAFIGTLAETGIVTLACRRNPASSAPGLRRVAAAARCLERGQGRRRVASACRARRRS